MAEIRYLADEHIARAVRRALRRRGIGVVSPAEVGLLGAADTDYLAYAREQGYVVVTHDADFLRLHAAGEAHAGIVYCEQGSRSVGELVASLMLIHDVLERAEMAQQVEFI